MDEEEDDDMTTSDESIEIDFVIPWVDGSDSAWLDTKRQYDPAQGNDALTERYRDWGILPYWFRAVEQFAPWVHKIYFITCGHLPSWLDITNPKLVIVRHEDYIPSEYLPTFSTHPIELNLHRIKELSEHFVYFNDDMFLTSPMKKKDFFHNGLPCDAPIESAVMHDDYANPWSHILINDVAVINMHYDKHEVIRRYRRKWFSWKYRSGLLRNLLMYPYGKFASFKYMHLPSPYLKSTYGEVWKTEPKILDEVCKNRFRSVFDVNQYLMRYWQLVNGRFEPAYPLIGRLFYSADDHTQALQSIRSQQYKMICLNDYHATEETFQKNSREIQEAFAEILPKKSGFEK